MSGNAWIDYVKLYREKNPHLSYREAMSEAKVSYRKLKDQMGGNGSKCEGCKYNSPGQRNHMGPGGCMANNNNSNNNSRNNSKHNYKSKTCEGCKYNSPGQRNHMGPGGCMANNSNNNHHHGGYDNIDLRNPQMRFAAGVSPLNSNLVDIGRKVIY
jgi:hypothetical protein